MVKNNKNFKKENVNKLTLGDGKEVKIKNPTKTTYGKIIMLVMIIGMAGLSLFALIYQLVTLFID